MQSMHDTDLEASNLAPEINITKPLHRFDTSREKVLALKKTSDWTNMINSIGLCSNIYWWGSVYYRPSNLVEILNAESILARRYFYPGCHRMEPYRSMARNQGISLPVTDTVARQVICLPNGTAVTTREVRQICDIINFAICNGGELSDSLANSV